MGYNPNWQRKPSYNKYRNKPTYIDGIRFASKREAARYQILKLLEKNGNIKSLRCQPRFDFPMKFFYKADFSYIQNGEYIVEDVKGIETDVFRLKRKCFKYFFPDIELRMVK